MKNTEQFNASYGMPPRYGEHPILARQARYVVEQQLEIVRAVPGRPENMAFFENELAPDTAAAGLEVGYFCNVVPPELIRAAGARPARLDSGNTAVAQRGEETLSGEICPLVKGAYGSFLDAEGRANQCAALIIPTTCDAKRKLGEILADYKPTFMLNIPPEQDARAYGKFAERELARMVDFLENQLGVRIRRNDLAKEIEHSNQRARLLKAIIDERAAQPASLSYRDAQLIIQALQSGANPDEWSSQAELVLKRIRDFRSDRPSLAPRVVLTGAPLLWPNFKLLNLIEESGAHVVADTLCSGFQSYVDPIRHDESSFSALLRALASRYIFSAPCPCFVSQGTRISRVIELVEEFKADAVINYGLRLCPLFDMEVPRLSQVLRDRAIPFANLRTDYSIEDTEQLRVRLEAFLETVGDQL